MLMSNNILFINTKNIQNNNLYWLNKMQTFKNLKQCEGMIVLFKTKCVTVLGKNIGMNQ